MRKRTIFSGSYYFQWDLKKSLLEKKKKGGRMSARRGWGECLPCITVRRTEHSGKRLYSREGKRRRGFFKLMTLIAP